jgi:hypothetical protein
MSPATSRRSTPEWNTSGLGSPADGEHWVRDGAAGHGRVVALSRVRHGLVAEKLSCGKG